MVRLTLVTLFFLMLTPVLANASATFSVDWKLVANQKPNKIEIDNGSGKTEKLYIHLNENSANVFIIGCNNNFNPTLSAGSTTLCEISDGQSITWYLANTKSSNTIGTATGSYQIEMET